MASGESDGTPAIHIRDRGWLPHVDVPGGTYFLTFRLEDSLPPSVLAQLDLEHRRLELEARCGDRPLRPDVRQELRTLMLRRIEQELDKGAGECWLRRPDVASMVQGALLHFDGDRYDMRAWCVMPNHVHAVARLLPESALSEVLHTWKSYSSRTANRLIGRKGRFWQADYYDHVVRKPEDLRRCIDYVLANPRKSGLKNWPWVGSRA